MHLSNNTKRRSLAFEQDGNTWQHEIGDILVDRWGRHSRIEDRYVDHYNTEMYEIQYIGEFVQELASKGHSRPLGLLRSSKDIVRYQRQISKLEALVVLGIRD